MQNARLANLGAAREACAFHEVSNQSGMTGADRELHLADLGVAREAVRVFVDGGGGGAPVGADLDDGAPLGEARPLLVVRLAPVPQPVQALQAPR